MKYIVIDIDYLDKSHTCSRVRSMGEYGIEVSLFS